MMWSPPSAVRPWLQVPASRLQLLQGQAGDLDAWGAPGVAWVLGSGHTPGHVVYLHTQHGVLFAGDAISFLLPTAELDWAAGSKAPADSRVGGWPREGAHAGASGGAACSRAAGWQAWMAAGLEALPFSLQRS